MLTDSEEKSRMSYFVGVVSAAAPAHNAGMPNFRQPTPAEALLASRIATPIGRMTALQDADGALVYLDFEDPKGPTPPPGADTWRGQPVAWHETPLGDLAAQLTEYFDGRRRAFDLALAPRGEGFVLEVWAELTRIPYGTTISYGELAGRLGRPGAQRAVGRANGLNPIAVIVPCHRVIGADGKLTGYSGGIERKAELLALEQATTPLGQATLPLGIGAPRGKRKT
jgi:methylated-DNA-[protein]-cysteine S-methyltransferase